LRDGAFAPTEEIQFLSPDSPPASSERCAPLSPEVGGESDLTRGDNAAHLLELVAIAFRICVLFLQPTSFSGYLSVVRRKAA
jgi:hypothetical protein